MAASSKLAHAPGGLLPENQHHQIGEDGIAHLDSAGTVFKMVDGQMVELQADGKPVEGKEPAPTSAAAGPGWVTYASWPPGQKVNRFVGSWSVPEPPADIKAQIIFLHIGLKGSSAGQVVFAPIVLQWGRTPFGGGLFWSIACWLQTGSNIMVGNYVQVAPGEKIEAEILRTPGSPELWSMSATGGAQQATLAFSLAEPLTEALTYGGVLEAYALDMQCAKYPADPAINFGDLSVDGQRGALEPTWQATNLVQDCGQETQIIDQAKVDILFRSAS